MKKLNVMTLEQVKAYASPEQIENRPEELTAYYTLPCGAELATVYNDPDGTEYAECADGHTYRRGEYLGGIAARWYTYTKTPADRLDDLVGGPAVWYRSGADNYGYTPCVVTGWNTGRHGVVWVAIVTTDGKPHRAKSHNIITTRNARHHAAFDAAREAEDFAVRYAEGGTDEQDSPYDSPTDGQWK